MKLGLIQTIQNHLYDFKNTQNMIPREKVISYMREMEEQTLTLIREACIMGCDMILTTEAVNFCGQQKNIDCDYTEMIPEINEYLFKKVSELAKEYHTYIILGAYNKRENKMYNSALVYNRDGELMLIYDKIHLAGSENDRLTSGKDYAVMDTEYGKIGLAICWDMQFPESCRELMLRGADLILCPTWGWEQIYGHARAYENGVYVASAMSVPYQSEISGIRNPSEIISPEGEVLARGSLGEAEVISLEFDMRSCSLYKEMRNSNRHPETYKRIHQI